jgi:hypothetical protein
MDFMERVMKSGKVKYSGIYADVRGGFFVINLASPEELKLLIGAAGDVINVKAHPIVPLETLAKLSQKTAK